MPIRDTASAASLVKFMPVCQSLWVLFRRTVDCYTCTIRQADKSCNGSTDSQHVLIAKLAMTLLCFAAAGVGIRLLVRAERRCPDLLL